MPDCRLTKNFECGECISLSSNPPALISGCKSLYQALAVESREMASQEQLPRPTPQESPATTSKPTSPEADPLPIHSTPSSTTTTNFHPSLHNLLLLSDSALPLGSFAYSSGLESFLAHHNLSGPKSHDATRLSAFETFLEQSLHNLASTSLPYLLTAWHSPSQLFELDNDLDASTLCTVARRASINQGRALIGVWERAFASNYSNSSSTTNTTTSTSASQTLHKFSLALKSPPPPNHPFPPQEAIPIPTTTTTTPPQAHFAPLFGTICAALSLSRHSTAYIYLLNHAKAVLSAAVRASILGPYQNQAILASGKLQNWIQKCIEGNEKRSWEDARTEVPVMDLWMGRHELLYSRIFNS